MFLSFRTLLCPFLANNFEFSPIYSEEEEGNISFFDRLCIVFADDVVYQQTGVVGATLDKRRPDLRDELGYIAPPNRKLPPVPGSNYNTCDRIKRGTVISK